MFIIAKYALTLTGVVFNFMIPLLQRKVRAIICFGKKKKKKKQFYYFKFTIVLHYLRNIIL